MTETTTDPYTAAMADLAEQRRVAEERQALNAALHAERMRKARRTDRILVGFVAVCAVIALILGGVILRADIARGRQEDRCYAAVQVVDANGRPQVNDPACQGLSDDEVARLVQRAITHAERS